MIDPIAAVQIDLNITQLLTGITTTLLGALVAIGWRMLKYIPWIKPYHEEAMSAIAETKAEVVAVGSRAEIIAKRQEDNGNEAKMVAKKVMEIDQRLEVVERHITKAP